jgi:pimeloyl-ACP methyl ester carboxylesterase
MKFAQVATEMRAALPNARLELIPDAGHAIHLERPQLYLQRVSTFLEDLQRNEFHELKEEVA